MRTEDFAYILPDELIAQHPAEPRDSSRLLVLHRASAQVEHRVFSDIVDYLNPGDLLVVNETRVLPARILGARAGTGGAVELLLLRERESARLSPFEAEWECLVKPGRKAKIGSRMEFRDDGDLVLTADVVEVGAEGIRTVRLRSERNQQVIDVIHAIGEVPLPPYITEKVADPERYQTVYATDEHSAAAPTAGLHFTAELLDRIRDRGIEVATVRLDVGLDTFRPVADEDPRDHHIHTEYYQVPEATVTAVERAKAQGGRVVAVGTTATRALESAAVAGGGTLVAAAGPTSLYILPGFEFRVVDALLTNFHVPRSTLLMMISAFAGRDFVLSAYQTAVAERYRFFSFGDAMLIV